MHPKDGGDNKFKEKVTKRKIFYGCSNYPKCDFVLWAKPEKVKCENCGFEGMVRLKDKYKCIKCGHIQQVQEDSSEE